MRIVLCIAWIMGMRCVGQITAYLSVPMVILLCSLILGVWLVQRHLPQLGTWLQLLLGSVLVFGLGLSYAQYDLTERMQLRELQRREATVIAYVGQINQLGHDEKVQQVIWVLDQKPQPVQWQAYASSETNLTLGQYYQLSGTIRPAQSYVIDGAFDQEQWYLQQNLMASFTVQQVQPLTVQDIEQRGYDTFVKQQQRWAARFKLAIETQRLALREFIQQQPLRQQGLLLALMTADESLLQPHTRTLFLNLGLSHLLAISGPHVLIFATLLCWTLQYFIARFCPQIYLSLAKPYLLILPFLGSVLLYCSFVGFEIPAMRTLLMCTLVAVLMLLGKRLAAFELLLYSASLLLLFDPLSVLSASFWLSYGACFVLLRIYQTLNKQPKTPDFFKNLQQLLWAFIESQWKIFIALLPLMILFFKQVAWLSPISNLIAIPWLGLITVPMDILAGVSFFVFKPLAALLLQINDGLLSLLVTLLSSIANGFALSLKPIALNLWQWLLLCVLLVILFLPRGVVPKTWAALCALPLFWPTSSQQNFELQVLDVGQGQAIFIRDQAHSMMVDMGGYYDETKFSVGRQLILPFLSVNGVEQLEHLVLTHLDQDHSGGYLSLQQQLKIAHISTSQPLHDAVNTPVQLCQRGQQWSWEERVDFQVLSPIQPLSDAQAKASNEHSCVLYITLKQLQPAQHFLLMGDAGWETEYQILRAYPQLQVDVLVLGHHGSKHSSSYAFLEHYRPKIAITSAGLDNRYGHPSKELKARLQDLNIPLYNTAEVGSIQFKVQQQQLHMQLQRQSKLWLTREASLSNLRHPL